MTQKQWKEVSKYCKKDTTCFLCEKRIQANEEGVTYIKTRMGLHAFIHDVCLKAKKKEKKNG